MSKLFALENDNAEDTVIEDAVTVEEGEAAAAVTEVETDGAEIEAVATAVDEGTDASEDLEEVQDLVADAAENGEGLDTVAAEAVRLSLKAICKRVGADPKSVYALYATENFSSASSRKANTEFALEGVTEFLKDMYKRIKAALLRMWEKVKAFWNKHLSTLGRLKKAVESMKTKVKASGGKLKGNAFLDKAPSGLASAFAGKGDLSVKSLAPYAEAQKKFAGLSRSFPSVMEALATNVDNVDALGADLKKFAESLKKEDDGILAVGGDMVKLNVNVDDDGKNLSLSVDREPIENKDEDRGFVIPNKQEMASLLDGCVDAVKFAIETRKDAEKEESKARDALAKIEAAIGKAEEGKTEGLRTSMNAVYRINAKSAQIRSIGISQNVRYVKAVLSFVSFGLKQYK